MGKEGYSHFETQVQKTVKNSLPSAPIAFVNGLAIPHNRIFSYGENL